MILFKMMALLAITTVCNVAIAPSLHDQYNHDNRQYRTFVNRWCSGIENGS